MDNDTIVGPVELAVIGFPETRFTGAIAPALADLVEGGVVSILDLVFVTKDNDGNVAGIELSELEDSSSFDQVDGEVNGLLSEEDLQAASELLAPGSSAALIVWENTWARTLVSAILEAGGHLVAHDRLDAETVQQAMAAARSE
jgi:Family of unknown function (DUF6325)